MTRASTQERDILSYFSLTTTPRATCDGSPPGGYVGILQVESPSISNVAKFILVFDKLDHCSWLAGMVYLAKNSINFVTC